MQTTIGVSQSAWKKVFLILSICIIIILPTLSKDYGQSGDEWLEIEYGQDIYNYFFHSDQQALSYANKSLQYSGMELYGGFFDYTTEILHHWLPNVPILDLKHFCNALFSAFLMIFTGLFAYRLSKKKWSVGVVALLFILFSPRIFGEGMNNPKDIPHACGFIIGMYGLIALLQDMPNKMWRNAILIAIGFTITFGSRPAGGILEFAFFIFFIALYYILNKEFKQLVTANNNKLLKRFFLFFIVAIGIGFGIALLTWPFGFVAPISHSLESLQGMTNRSIVLRVLFEGEYHYNNNMPWYYEFKWMCISNPIVVLAGIVLFIALIRRGYKQYGPFAIIVVLFSGLFPLLYIIYKHSSVHDTWRHVFFVYAFWVVTAALGWDLAATFIKNESKRWVITLIAILGLLPEIIWTADSHPNQYVYFNALAGGEKGAYGYYDLDYYQNTNKQLANWISKNVKPIPGRKIIVLTNMLGFDKFFTKDTAWLSWAYGRYNDRSQKDWDYYIDNPRFLPVEQFQNDMWPPQNVVYAVTVHGVPLSVIIKNKSKDGIAAYEAFQKKDFATATTKYASYIQTDTTDENVYVNYGIALASIGKVDAAIQALNKATQLDPSQAQYFEVLSQLYHAKGDEVDAQKAMSNAQNITMKDQDEAGSDK